MKILLSLTLIISAYAIIIRLQLPNPTCSDVSTQRTTLLIPKTETWTNLISKLNNIQSFVGPSLSVDIAGIAKDILSKINSAQGTVQLTWNMKLDRELGVLRGVRIQAVLEKLKDEETQVVLDVKHVDAIQEVPEVYNLERVCAATGKRRFGIIGPQERRCRDVAEKRDMRPQEIEEVKRSVAKQLINCETLLK